MPTKLGNTTLTAIRFNTTSLSKLYHGNTEIFSSYTPPTTYTLTIKSNIPGKDQVSWVLPEYTLIDISGNTITALTDSFSVDNNYYYIRCQGLIGYQSTYVTIDLRLTDTGRQIFSNWINDDTGVAITDSFYLTGDTTIIAEWTENEPWSILGYSSFEPDREITSISDVINISESQILDLTYKAYQVERDYSTTYPDISYSFPYGEEPEQFSIDHKFFIDYNT